MTGSAVDCRSLCVRHSKTTSSDRLSSRKWCSCLHELAHESVTVQKNDKRLQVEQLFDNIAVRHAFSAEDLQPQQPSSSSSATSVSSSSSSSSTAETKNSSADEQGQDWDKVYAQTEGSEVSEEEAQHLLNWDAMPSGSSSSSSSSAAAAAAVADSSDDEHEPEDAGAGGEDGDDDAAEGDVDAEGDQQMAEADAEAEVDDEDQPSAAAPSSSSVDDESEADEDVIMSPAARAGPAGNEDDHEAMQEDGGTMDSDAESEEVPPTKGKRQNPKVKGEQASGKKRKRSRKPRAARKAADEEVRHMVVSHHLRLCHLGNGCRIGPIVCNEAAEEEAAR